ncbi:MAG TPA: aspartate kinase [Flavobacteriaceae bacterium]|nr:aspartate kinase [Flavobacteriaceae bacterium]MAY53475.1 aspartate kinase [Flavobacteriaceae bacterium]HBR54430.1 aspartate kinase [Flavobacteriaceae bacterium]|tara:strand:+ start:313775 stop:315031 length:1257 start_codon:yes stop_codon:yes gene_type:complete
MKVFKFGGASVKDAAGVKNVASVLQKTGEKDLLVVVSAMGKMTNQLEKVVDAYLSETQSAAESIQEFKEYHNCILNDLFTNSSHPVFNEVGKRYQSLSNFLEHNNSKNRPFVYDQIVGYGELVSTQIVSAYLSEVHIENTLLDVRSCIETDSNYRDAKVDWEATQEHISAKVSAKGITITQGFLGAEGANNFTTTLGREGSDYTAAIFAYCLNAESVTIWKDVPGVLNADPRYFSKTTLLNKISYREAIELAFYGASVIHPKTLQPLQRKEIPLFVKSFVNPLDPGTCVGKGVTLDPMVSCFILKKNQVLISLSSLDFNFMMEHHIGDVFKWLHTYKMKVELIQNSAISFSVCVDNKYDNLAPLLAKLRSAFKVSWNENVTLYTIRHADSKQIKAILKDKTLLVKQESRGTVQLVVKE